MRRRLVPLPLLLVLPVASCGGNEPSTAAPTSPAAASSPAKQAAQPRTEGAVREVAQEEFDTYASGDYSGAWDLWTTAGKRMISRADYEKVHELCPQGAKGLQFTIQKIRISGDGAVVRAQRSIAVMSFRFAYEQGQWRFVPDQAAVADYRYARRYGVQKLAAKSKAQGLCS